MSNLEVVKLQAETNAKLRAELDALRAENAKLRAALEFAVKSMSIVRINRLNEQDEIHLTAISLARAALKQS